MLEIILLILKIIGIVLLSILGLVVLILLLILFVPVRYKAQGEKHEEIKAEGRVTWLLHLLRIRITYTDGKLKTKGKLLFFTIINSDEDVEKELGEEEIGNGGGDEEDIDDSLFTADLDPAGSRTETDVRQETLISDIKEKFEKNKENEDKIIEEEEQKSGDSEVETVNTEESSNENENNNNKINADNTKAESIAEDIKENVTEDKTEENSSESQKSHDKEKLPGHKVGKKNRKKDKQEESEEGEKKQGIVKKVKKLYNIKNDPRAKRFYALAKKRLKKIIRHILPRKLKGSVRVGTGDPCSTGKILGAAAMIYPLYGGNISVEPVFEEKALEFDLRLRGRIRIITVGLPLLRTYRNRDFKYLRKKVKKAVK